MNVLLIMPYHNDLIHSVSLPLGIMSIGTYLQNHGINVKLCDFSIKKHSVKKIVKEFTPDIVGLSFPSAKAVDGIINISTDLRKYVDAPIVWGGQFVDVGIAETFFETGLVDILSFSEGENTWLDLVRMKETGGDLADVKGIAYWKDGKVVRTPLRPFLTADELPRINFDLVYVPDYFQYLYGCSRLVYIYLSKGCPASCSFCFNIACHRSTRRRRNLDDCISEITELVTKYKADGLYLGDELAFANDKELYEVCDAFRKTGLSFRWGFQTRVGALSQKAIQHAFDCGCRWIASGVETGNREMMKRITKGMPLDKVESTFHACSKAGIISLANFIIGLPGETEAQLRDTIALAKKIESTQNTFAQYMCLPNSPMGQELLSSMEKHPEFGQMTDFKQIDFFQNPMDVSEIPQKELNVIQSYFLLKAIFRKDYSDSRPYDMLLKFISTVIKNASSMNLTSKVKALTEVTTDFTRFCLDYTFQKGIRRKYGLK